MIVMLPGWTHELPKALEQGLTEAVAGIDWNSPGAISRVIDDPSCGIAVAVHQGHLVAYVKGVEVFNSVAADSPEAVTTVVTDIARAIRSHL